MKGKKKVGIIISLLSLTFLVAIVSVALFLFCYYSDNKYTAKGPQGQRGVLILSDQDLDKYSFVYLTMGWEIYRDKLLSPEDFKVDLMLPDEYVFIGQYGGLESKRIKGTNRSPHGSATYRLNISLPTKIKNYTLEIPEIYSTYRLYVNGELVGQMGEPNKENYYVQTGNSKISFRCADSMEIIIAVSDYSHFYSGMVYPPAFGESSAVEQMLNIRLGLRFAIIAISLGIGILYFGIWILLKNGKSKENILSLNYSALCLCFALYICYPVVKTLTTTGISWYTIENLALPIMLLLVTRIQAQITKLFGLPVRLITAIGIFVCGWMMAMPYIMGDSLNLMVAHSMVLTIYTWLTALFLLITSIYSAYQGTANSRFMLSGAVVFGTALMMDRLLPMFEPIRLGWFTEIAGSFFILSIGAVMVTDVVEQFRMRLLLEGRVSRVTHMMEVQKTYYPQILKKEEELRVARHDFRHHMAVIRELALAGNMPKLMAYIESFDNRVGAKAQVSFCRHFVIDMLLRMYAGLAVKQNTVFLVEANLSSVLPFKDIDLCVMLSNLLENALEASIKIPIEDRKITIRIRNRMNHLGIAIENTFDGTIRTSGQNFFSMKQNGREGIGLASVRTVCALYGGSAEFYVQEDKIFHSEIFLPMNHEEGKTYENSHM